MVVVKKVTLNQENQYPAYPEHRVRHRRTHFGDVELTLISA